VFQHAVAATFGTRLKALEETCPATTKIFFTFQRIDVGAVVVLGIGDGRSSTLRMMPAPFWA